MGSLARLCRTLISAPGTSSHSLISRSLSSTVVKNGDERDIDFVNRLSALQPSEEFKKALNKQQINDMEKILPELELYAYMADRVPNRLSNEDWEHLLRERTIKDRVCFLEHLALKERRHEKDLQRTKEDMESERQRIEAEKIKYDRGEMGYGHGMYALVTNLLRRLHLIHGSNVLKAIRNNYPRIIFDMQFLPTDSPRNRNLLYRQMSCLITENIEARTPLPLDFANIEESYKKELEKRLGNYSGLLTHQQILPDLSTRKLRSEVGKGKEVVYITRYAKDFLEGPLNADAYIVCCSMDTQKQSLGAARREKFRAVRIPIDKHIKWQSGPQYLPFPNIMRIFREVFVNNGDWKSALEKNISRRHTMSPEERESNHNQISKHRLRLRNREELIENIRSATGNQ